MFFKTCNEAVRGDMGLDTLHSRRDRAKFNNTGVSSNKAHQMSVFDMNHATAQRMLSKESRGGNDRPEIRGL